MTIDYTNYTMTTELFYHKGRIRLLIFQHEFLIIENVSHIFEHKYIFFLLINKRYIVKNNT